MKKGIIVIIIAALALTIFAYFNGMNIFKDENNKNNDNKDNSISYDINNDIERLLYNVDINGNAVDDALDIVAAARKEVDNKVTYISEYYQGGYPSEDKGVCTDVIWRALKNCGIDLKSAIDKDIRNNPYDYREGVSTPDPNIDFRRVKNQYVYFEKYYTKLTTEVIPNDIDNLSKWQPGDIVVKKEGEHVAIISDKRNDEGVPYVLHNYYDHAMEDNFLYDWYKDGKIIGHYRLNYEDYK